MLNYIDVKLDSIAVHHVGRHAEQEGVTLSDELLAFPEDDLMESLQQYFFASFKEPLFYSFEKLDGELDNNPMYQYVTQIFNQPEDLYDVSTHIAKYLYSNSKHVNIKSGDLFVFYFHDMLVDDELVSGLGICKAETKSTFLNVHRDQQPFVISRNEGIAISKMDKACLVFNTDQSDGYKMCIIDQSNQQEAQFWTHDFLLSQVRSDDYFNTKNYIEMTKSFVQDRMQPLYETDKIDEAEVMNRSQSFFASTDSFNGTDYANEVFPQQELATDFLDYRRDYQEERGVDLQDEFDVDQAAVKKQSRFFKSVLKLDKNFHIYIHGNRDMIERGTDDSGRKFYKVFYDKEA